MTPTLPALRAAAEKAKAWTPIDHIRCWRDSFGTKIHCDETLGSMCDSCLGAKRATEWVSLMIDESMKMLTNEQLAPYTSTYFGREHAAFAAKLADCFGSDDNPVAAFAALVREFVGGER